MDHIIQLGLNRYRKSDSEDPSVQIVWLIDQILELISENVIEDDDSTVFRSELEQLRRELLNAYGSSLSSPIALKTIDLCRNQFKKARSRRNQRDEHFAEIILFLRNALASLTGDSKSFHDSLLETSDRIKELIELDDIQELKQRVTAEVDELNRAVQEKHQREQVQFVQLAEQVSVLQRKLEAAKAEASIDGLTGIANRRNFDFTIQRWVIAHEKSEDPFTIAILDIDNFKHINDNYGHQTGDKVLISAAMELGKSIRSTDFLARFGGDEFVVLSEGMKLSEAEGKFSRLLKSMQTSPFECKMGDNEISSVSLTVSCGVAEYALGETAKDLIRRADEAMYEAKREGKNRVVTKRRSLLGAFYEGRKRTR